MVVSGGWVVLVWLWWLCSGLGLVWAIFWKSLGLIITIDVLFVVWFYACIVCHCMGVMNGFLILALFTWQRWKVCIVSVCVTHERWDILCSFGALNVGVLAVLVVAFSAVEGIVAYFGMEEGASVGFTTS